MPIDSGISDGGTVRVFDVDPDRRLQTVDRPVKSLLADLLTELIAEVRMMRLGMIAAGACKNINPEDAK